MIPVRCASEDESRIYRRSPLSFNYLPSGAVYTGNKTDQANYRQGMLGMLVDTHKSNDASFTAETSIHEKQR